MWIVAVDPVPAPRVEWQYDFHHAVLNPGAGAAESCRSILEATTALKAMVEASKGKRTARKPARAS